MSLTRFLTSFLRCIILLGAIPTSAQSEKSSITITDPAHGTVWDITKPAALQWSVENITSEKSIRFFLVRNEMVVQELGSFKNTGSTNGIALAKNIGSGDKYQVVGIELFPDNKYSIAKFVTPFFSIVNKASDARKRKKELAMAQPVPKKEKKNSKRKKVLPKKEEKSAGTQASKSTARQAFQGRKISYTKEFAFDSEEISIKIWDHGRQDGDIVSIFLNGAAVVSKHLLTYQKKEFNIKLNPNKSNDLFLYAHNLGNAPPNTVAIEITDGNKAENIVLNSDLQSCEAVMISVKK
ncbi:hypothetical protein [Maribacter sp. 2210JD10-5]|uniref:hypothetical protein n=1 Tax=Maribacter sp. 2210JD10-5 TaxID=3386272 RepID=UPI0039BC291C